MSSFFPPNKARIEEAVLQPRFICSAAWFAILCSGRLPNPKLVWRVARGLSWFLHLFLFLNLRPIPPRVLHVLTALDWPRSPSRAVFPRLPDQTRSHHLFRNSIEYPTYARHIDELRELSHLKRYWVHLNRESQHHTHG